jgi:alkylhydroperoxidase/carboxymuconolactone decarboxylase family protein YurZ
MATESGQAKASANQQPESLWAAARNQLKEWGRAWAERTVKTTTNPWMDGISPLLIQEASMGSLEDFSDLRKKRLERIGKATPAVEKMKAIGQWSEEWDSVLFLDLVWTDQYMAMCTSLCAENVLPPKELELLLVAFDADNLNIYGPGTRRLIKNAFKAGATVEEIMEVLKLGVVQGEQACNLGVTLLTEELERDASA